MQSGVVIQNCEVKRACGQKPFDISDDKVLAYTIDLDGPTTFQNWVTDLDLVCEEPYKIGLIGALSFISFSIGSALITKQADVSGRREVIIGSSMVTPICIALLLTIATNIYVVYVLVFIMGLTYNSRGSTAYLFGCEFLPTKKHLIYGQINFLHIGFIMVMAAIIFKTTRSQNFYFIIIALSMCVAIAWIMFVAPESP